MDELWSIWIKRIKASDCQETVQPLLEIAEQLGQFRVANLVAFPSSQLASYLGTSFLLRHIGSNFIKCSRFPYEEHVINEWFDLPVGGHQRNEPVKAINIDEEEGTTEECGSTLLNGMPDYLKSLSRNDSEIFFHGTSHEHAQTIIEDGIDVLSSLAKSRQDFSSSDGFYLGRSFKKASEWSGSRGYETSAVLVFRVKKTELRGDQNKKGMDLRGDNMEEKKEWQKVVTQFRSGNARKIRKKVKHYEFIEGPMASVSGENPNFDYPCQQYGTYQLCVRKNKCAKLFDRSLHSVIFFG